MVINVWQLLHSCSTLICAENVGERHFLFVGANLECSEASIKRTAWHGYLLVRRCLFIYLSSVFCSLGQTSRPLPLLPESSFPTVVLLDIPHELRSAGVGPRLCPSGGTLRHLVHLLGLGAPKRCNARDGHQVGVTAVALLRGHCPQIAAVLR